MLYDEFTSRTNIYPDSHLFDAIHREYMEHNEFDKDQFCAAYVENRDRIAERIKDDAEQSISNDVISLRTDAEDLKQKISHQETQIQNLNRWIKELRAALEKEEEWKSVKCSYRQPPNRESFSYVTNESAVDVVRHYLKDRISDDFEIIRETSVPEMNRHGKLRYLYSSKDIRPWKHIDIDSSMSTSKRDENACVVFRFAGQDYVLNVRHGEVFVSLLFDPALCTNR